MRSDAINQKGIEACEASLPSAQCSRAVSGGTWGRCAGGPLPVFPTEVSTSDRGARLSKEEAVEGGAGRRTVLI